jgi:hypothetical protein
MPAPPRRITRRRAQRRDAGVRYATALGVACAALRLRVRLRACGEKAEADERKLVHVGKPANGRNGRLVKRRRENRAQLAAAPNAWHARDVSRSAASVWRKREAGCCMCRATPTQNKQRVPESLRSAAPHSIAQQHSTRSAPNAFRPSPNMRAPRIAAKSGRNVSAGCDNLPGADVAGVSLSPGADVGV